MSIDTDEQIADAWVKFYIDGEDSNFSATEKLLDITYSNQERAWNIVRLINEILIHEENWKEFIDAILAAGPIEDLLSLANVDVLSGIEKNTFQNERFKTQLELVNKDKIDCQVLENLRDIISGK